MTPGVPQPNRGYSGTYQPVRAGSDSELAVREFTGEGQPVIDAHFHDVRSLQTYLTRAAKDPAAPKKLKLQIATNYSWTKAKAVIDACKAAGFSAVELASVSPEPDAPARAGGPARAGPGPADVARVRLNSVHLDQRLLTAVPDFTAGVEYGPSLSRYDLRTDALVFDEATGQCRDWKDLRPGQILRLYFTPREVDPSRPVGKVGILAWPARAKGYVIEAPDVLRIDVGLKDGDTTIPLPDQTADRNYPVRPDGTVALGRSGPVKVAGMQIPAATDAIRAHIAGHTSARASGNRLTDVIVGLDVVGYNSKKYYVITDAPEAEQVYAFPLTGSETVLDAIGSVSGLADRADTAVIAVARPGGDGRPVETLRVDWKGITEQGRTETNYQLEPGDRVYVKPKK
jgi:polysaccharide export outer membrane protein